MGRVFRYPAPGERVGDYRILGKIGSGGFGTVFKAERAGLFFAVKFLRSSELGAREKRELSILLRLENPCVVRFRAFDRWPDPKNGLPYLVMDYLEGMTLEEFAEVENPSARRSARILLETALALGEVHGEGVFHRDLKPENILITDKGERPVLIDFGVGSYTGAPVVTPFGLPPGTYEYRSPQAYLFHRANTDLAHYEFSAADDLWALGVIFYWLLANVLPFGSRSDPEGGGLVERILLQRPVAPHLLNPRVPRALSDLCLRMLEKKPEDRCASIVDLCVALGGAMADAELDESWDLPLFEPDAPHPTMTEEDPALVNEGEPIRWVREWASEQPRRGRKPRKVAALNQDELPTVVSQSTALAHAEAGPKASAPPADVAAAVFATLARIAPHLLAEALPSALPPQAPARGEERRTPPAPPPRPPHRPLLLVAVAGLAVALLAGAVLFTRSPAPPPVSGQPNTSPDAITTQHAEFGHEIAPPTKPLNLPARGGAEPITDSITPPVMTMNSENGSKGKPQKKQTKMLGRTTKVIGTGLICNALAGCPSPQQVRPTPETPECPAGWEETLTRFKVFYTHTGRVVFLGYEQHFGREPITVKEGPTTMTLWMPLGEIPEGTRLTGTLTLDPEKNRFFGRFTQAQTPDQKTYPVCLDIYRDAPRTDCPVGMGDCPMTPGGKPEAFMAWYRLYVKATGLSF